MFSTKQTTTTRNEVACDEKTGFFKNSSGECAQCTYPKALKNGECTTCLNTERIVDFQVKQLEHAVRQKSVCSQIFKSGSLTMLQSVCHVAPINTLRFINSTVPVKSVIQAIVKIMASQHVMNSLTTKFLSLTKSGLLCITLF